MMNNDQPIEILLVEDNPGDVRLTMVKDGVEALAFLRREGDFADAPRPDLILLDLNLPKKDGREVLADIKADPTLRRIPVVVLTVSKDEEDILKSYDLYANCYVTKPINMEQFIAVVRSIEDFWLTIVKLPYDIKR
jgi:CheY-like chemotaxis protein